MTKQVRIENADTSDYKVEVQVWEKQPVPDGACPLPDVLVNTHYVNYPTAMIQDYLTSTRYFVVKEV